MTPCPVVIFILASVGFLSGAHLIHISTNAAQYSAQAQVTTLGTHALIAYVPTLVLGQMWCVAAGFLGASVLIVVRGRRAWALFTIVVTISVAESVLVGPRSLQIVWLACITWGTGMALSGICKLVAGVTQMRVARDEQVHYTIIRERIRFSRDLHDLLGYSLSAIALKAELAHRTMHQNPSLADDELVEVIETARQALTDVRTAAHGYRNISLTKEVSTVESLLKDAGIRTCVDLAYGALDENADSVLAAVLREAATNVLKHSTARHCSIAVHQVDGDRIRLTIANDGVSCSARMDNHGSGLSNMASRLREIDGELITRVSGTGPCRFEVVVELPCTGTHVVRHEWERSAIRGISAGGDG